MEDEKVKQLAGTLRKQGLAASEYEAIEKAKSILNVKIQNNNSSQEEDKPSGREMKQVMPNLDLDIKNQNISLNELMKEINVEPEQVEAQEQAKLDDLETEVNIIKKDIRESEKNPEKTEQIKEEIAKVKEDVSNIEEIKTENEPQKTKEQPEEDIFKDEKKIDLTKIFGNKK